MAAGSGVVVDPAVGREETPRVARWLGPLHPALSPSRRLVRHLGPVVQVPAPPVFAAGRDAALGCVVAPELVGDGHARRVPQTARQLAEEP